MLCSSTGEIELVKRYKAPQSHRRLNLKNSLILLIVLLLVFIAGCSVAERPVMDRNTVLRILYAQRQEMAAEVEYKKYLMELENRDEE